MENISENFARALDTILRERLPRGIKKELAEFMNISTGHLSDILSMRRGSSEEQRRAIMRFLADKGLDIDYEDFILAGQMEDDLSAIVKQPGQISDSSADDFVYIKKVAARLSAGGGSLLDSAEEIGSMAFRRDWAKSKGRIKDFVLMDVMGESMEPVIYDGDMVLLDLSKTDIRDGKYYAVAYDDSVYIKKVAREPGKIILVSENPNYTPIEIDLGIEQPYHFQIIGRAVWWCHDERV